MEEKTILIAETNKPQDKFIRDALIKNKYGKLVEYKVIESNSKCNKVEMVFTRKDGTYSGTDIIRYPLE